MAAAVDVMLKLDESSLAKDPEVVFDLLEKLGEGSYGSVFRAMHKETSKVVAVKQVPVEGTDLQDIIKEISIMQQCDSDFIVKYYGSYFKKHDLWIVMEYCGAGSVVDLMRVRKQTMTEKQIAAIFWYSLKGLDYLHSSRKIHRDIKAGNILLNRDGQAKLADFGVAGQLSDTMQRRNTVIGTPFWMAPEVIQEVGYNTLADIWSLGITAIEMAEGKPPHADIHPMRAIFMIPSSPPPTLRRPSGWNQPFIDFISKCLVKNPSERATAQALLLHPFVAGSANACNVLKEPIDEAQQILASGYVSSDGDTDNGEEELDTGTIVPGGAAAAAAVAGNTYAGTGPLTPASSSEDDVPSDTMVYRDDANDGDDADTMRRVEPADNTANREYKPAFMAHFEELAAAKKPVNVPYSQLKTINVVDLQKRLAALDVEKQRELSELSKRYEEKRAPILAAIALKQ